MVIEIDTNKGKVVAARAGVPPALPANFVVVALFLFLAMPQICAAESAASKNNRGNRLFAQGKYEDAEKSYIAAQSEGPGKPEVSYNLGNSLIKQKKYREGVQALGQSIGKGDKGISEKSWFNTGNALYSEGNYKDSAAAYVEALKLDPSDQDAKHNLELALMKLRQQEQEKSNKDSKQQQNSKNENKDKPSGSKESQPKQPQNNQSGSGNKDQQKGMEKPQPMQFSRPEGAMSKEQALQLLDAVQAQETKEQRQLLENRAREKARGKDW